jgi:mono/diheme cytochrome c family protein
MSASGVIRIAAALFAAALIGQAIAQAPAPTLDPSWSVPSRAAERENPMRDKPEAAAGGRKLYQRSCLMCHGDATHARTNHAPDLAAPAAQAESDGALFWRISNGNPRRAMPSFSGMPEAQRWQLVLYIRSLAAAGNDASHPISNDAR